MRDLFQLVGYVKKKMITKPPLTKFVKGCNPGPMRLSNGISCLLISHKEQNLLSLGQKRSPMQPN